MLFRLAGNLDFVSPFIEAGVHDSFLDIEDPEGEGAVEKSVKGYGDSCVELGVVEAKFVVPVEGCRADGEGSVA